MMRLLKVTSSSCCCRKERRPDEPPFRGLDSAEQFTDIATATDQTETQGTNERRNTRTWRKSLSISEQESSAEMRGGQKTQDDGQPPTKLWKFNLRQLAEHLTKNDAEMLKSICISELQEGKWMKKDKEKLSPNVIAMISQFNRFAYQICTEIVTEETLGTRIMIVSNYIKLMENLQRLHNYNSMTAIKAALTILAIHRLTDTWSGLSKRQRKKFEDFSNSLCLVSNANGILNDMTELCTTNVPCVPYLGWLLHIVARWQTYEELVTRSRNSQHATVIPAITVGYGGASAEEGKLEKKTSSEEETAEARGTGEVLPQASNVGVGSASSVSHHTEKNESDDIKRDASAATKTNSLQEDGKKGKDNVTSTKSKSEGESKSSSSIKGGATNGAGKYEEGEEEVHGELVALSSEMALLNDEGFMDITDEDVLESLDDVPVRERYQNNAVGTDASVLVLFQDFQRNCLLYESKNIAIHQEMDAILNYSTILHNEELLLESYKCQPKE